MKCIEEFINKADTARKYWLESSIEQYEFVLLLPHYNKSINESILNAFIKKLSDQPLRGNPKKALVLSVGKIEKGPLYTNRIITEDLAASILTLYGMYAFTDKLIIGSMELPYGRKIKNLLDCGIGSEEGLLNSIIF